MKLVSCSDPLTGIRVNKLKTRLKSPAVTVSVATYQAMAGSSLWCPVWSQISSQELMPVTFSEKLTAVHPFGEAFSMGGILP